MSEFLSTQRMVSNSIWSLEDLAQNFFQVPLKSAKARRKCTRFSISILVQKEIEQGGSHTLLFDFHRNENTIYPITPNEAASCLILRIFSSFRNIPRQICPSFSSQSEVLADKDNKKCVGSFGSSC